MTLVEFLLAGIAEDAEDADAVCYDHGGMNLEPMHERMLAECEAKRRIVEQYQAAVREAAEETDTEAGWVADGVEGALLTTVRILALPYADHPDYDESWRP